MPGFLLTHSHAASECAVCFAAWQGSESPLRRAIAQGSCLYGGPEHRIWWPVEAADETAALALLPDWVAERTVAARLGPIAIP